MVKFLHCRTQLGNDGFSLLGTAYEHLINLSPECFSGHQVKDIHPVVEDPPHILTASQKTLILTPMKFNSLCWINLPGGNL